MDNVIAEVLTTEDTATFRVAVAADERIVLKIEGVDTDDTASTFLTANQAERVAAGLIQAARDHRRSKRGGVLVLDGDSDYVITGGQRVFGGSRR